MLTRWPSAVIGRALAGLLSLAFAAAAPSDSEIAPPDGDSVTQWSLIADDYGEGAANWRTLAIMQMAMHDALNAAHPVYARWWPPAPGEPAADGANPEVAMAAAADQVLLMLHPDHKNETDTAFQAVLTHYADNAGKAAGIRLGKAIGAEAVKRRVHDGFDERHLFQGENEPGRWRPTPSLFATSPTNDVRPFLFASASDVPTTPPPKLGTARYQQQVAATRSLGGINSTKRTPEETEDAYFWAYQSSQRGFLNLAVRLLAAHPPPGGNYEEARIMAELTVALANSAILTWDEKAKYYFWRPITAIRADRQSADATWAPLIETPPFPEYPSGHATDCYVGAGVLEAAFPHLAGPILYVSSAHLKPLYGTGTAAPPPNFGMGQHAQWDVAGVTTASELRFPDLAVTASNCATSRIWAGAHFPAAAEESKRLAAIIVQRALSATPPAH